MSSTKSIPIVAALICISPAMAREATVTRFNSSAASAVADTGKMERLLGLQLQSIVGTAGAFHTAERSGAIKQRATRSVEHLSIAVASHVPNIACSGNRYLPTWWLPLEVESRRAAYFKAISNVACENGLPASLLDAVVAQESGYKAWAISSAGAMGMMQVMPGTAKHLELWNPWDALANMRAGARYLRQQLDRFGRVDLALAAYNAGPERRSLTMGNIPAIPETRNYVRTITTNWLRLTQLNRPDFTELARTAAASAAVRASGYREVSLVTYDGMNAANPI